MFEVVRATVSVRERSWLAIKPLFDEWKFAGPHLFLRECKGARITKWFANQEEQIKDRSVLRRSQTTLQCNIELTCAQGCPEARKTWQEISRQSYDNQNLHRWILCPSLKRTDIVSPVLRDMFRVVCRHTPSSHCISASPRTNHRAPAFSSSFTFSLKSFSAFSHTWLCDLFSSARRLGNNALLKFSDASVQRSALVGYAWARGTLFTTWQ